MSNQNNLGLLINARLRELAWTQRRLVEKTGIDKTTISEIISGKQRLSPEHAKRIAEVPEWAISDLDMLIAANEITKTNIVDDAAVAISNSLDADKRELWLKIGRSMVQDAQNALEEHRRGSPTPKTRGKRA